MSVPFPYLHGPLLTHVYSQPILITHHPGTFASGTAACASCPIGQYNDVVGQSCKSCASGKCSGPGSSSCVPCDPVPNGNGGCLDDGSGMGEACVSINRAGSLGGLIDDIAGTDMAQKNYVLKKYGPIHGFDTSQVTDMSYVFSGYNMFAGDLSAWVTTQVTTMTRMFGQSGMDGWVFGDFKRTMCGGAWESLSGDNRFNHVTHYGTEVQGYARTGCCPPNTFMSSPELSPFSPLGSCSACPLASDNNVENDETSCGGVCPGGTVLNLAESYGTLSGTSFTPYDFRPTSQGGQGDEQVIFSINGKVVWVSFSWNCDTAVNCAAGLMEPMGGMMSQASATVVEGNLVLTSIFNYQASTMSILLESPDGGTSGPNALALFGTNPIVHDVSSPGCVSCVAGQFNKQGGATCKNCPWGQYSAAQQSSCAYEKRTCPVGKYSSGAAACCVCPVGRFNDVVGITSAAQCKTCAIGTCSAAGSSSCSTCDALPEGNGEDYWQNRVAGTLNRVVDDYLQVYGNGGKPADASTKEQIIAQYGFIENWNVALVTNFQNLFSEKRTFDSDISKWDVSSVQNMKQSE